MSSLAYNSVDEDLQKFCLKSHERHLNKMFKNRAQINFSNAAVNYANVANVQKKAADDLFKLIEYSPSDKNKLCVDLGSGPLVNTPRLKNRYGSVLAMDLSLNMLKNSNLAALRVCADMDTFPIQAASVDVIYSNFAVQWSTNLELLLQSLFKALKHGGQAYISTVVEGSLSEIKTAFAAVDSHNHVNTFDTVTNINHLVQMAGFTISQSTTKVYTDCYSSPLNAIRSIKSIGATTKSNDNNRLGLLTKTALKKVCMAYPLANKQACVSYHVVLLSLIKA